MSSWASCFDIPALEAKLAFQGKDELSSVTLNYNETAWPITPSSHAPCEILGKSLWGFGLILCCNYWCFLSLAQSWPSSIQTWSQSLLLPRSMHCAKLTAPETSSEGGPAPWINPATSSSNNLVDDHLHFFLGRRQTFWVHQVKHITSKNYSTAGWNF